MLVYDNINNNGSSFNTSFRSGNGKAFVQAYATSGMVANTPYAIQLMGSGYNATIFAASIWAYVGVPERVTASGCVGWVQIRGEVNDVQFGTADASGPAGHSVFWGAAALGASSSIPAYNPVIGQVGCLLETVDESTTANIWLAGMWATAKA